MQCYQPRKQTKKVLIKDVSAHIQVKQAPGYLINSCYYG